MVRIRLRRMGAKKKPFYRIVVADKRSPRDGRFIETIGTYNPLTNPETVEIKLDRAAHWLSKGAQPSDAVARLLRTAGLLDENGKPLPLEIETEASTDETVEASATDEQEAESEAVEGSEEVEEPTEEPEEEEPVAA